MWVRGFSRQPSYYRPIAESSVEAIKNWLREVGSDEDGSKAEEVKSRLWRTERRFYRPRNQQSHVLSVGILMRMDDGDVD